MKLSAKSRYAARILLELAMYGQPGPMTASLLAERTGITIQFIEQILRTLRQGNLTRSVRGVSGGHVLANEPEKISLGDIVRTMEGGINLTLCSADDQFPCPRRQICLTYPAWSRLSRVLEQEMDAISLRELILAHEQNTWPPLDGGPAKKAASAKAKTR